jgi:hypothetical protein
VGEPPASEPEEVDTLGGTEAMLMEAAPADDALASPDAAGLAATALDPAAPAEDASAQDVAARSAERLPVDAGSPGPALAPLTDSPGMTGDGAMSPAGSADQRLDADIDDETAIVSDGNGSDADPGSTWLDLGTVLIVTGVALVAVGLVLGLSLLLSRRHPDATRG